MFFVFRIERRVGVLVRHDLGYPSRYDLRRERATAAKRSLRGRGCGNSHCAGVRNHQNHSTFRSRQCDGLSNPQASWCLPRKKRLPKSAPEFVQVSTGGDRVHTFHYRVTKRLLDLAAGLLLAVFCSPLILVLAISIALTSGWPVFVIQERVGRSGQRFRLLKFRTLPKEALHRADREWSAKPASRWTGFLRDMGLDELPQLINVIRGEMSLVGPRSGAAFLRGALRKGITVLWSAPPSRSGADRLGADSWLARRHIDRPASRA